MYPVADEVVPICRAGTVAALVLWWRLVGAHALPFHPMTCPVVALLRASFAMVTLVSAILEVIIALSFRSLDCMVRSAILEVVTASALIFGPVTELLVKSDDRMELAMFNFEYAIEAVGEISLFIIVLSAIFALVTEELARVGFG